MTWTALIVEFFAGLFSGAKAVKVAKAAGELEAGKREIAAVDADVAAIKGELLPGPTTPPQPSPAPVAPTQPAPAAPSALSSRVTD